MFEELSVKPEQIKSLRDIALEKLREAIVSGYLKPGEHLREREIAEVMGVSTTPIKEALRILAREGLVETIPRKGNFVSMFAQSTIEETLLLRANLEGLCASLAAVKMTDEELSALEEKVLQMEQLTKQKDKERLIVENTNFHMMIREAAKNPMISQILMNVYSLDQAFRKRALGYQPEIEEGYSEHREIYEAIKSRKPDLAEEKMKSHILRTMKNVFSGKST